MKYGDDKDLSAVDEINSVPIPVLVISAAENPALSIDKELYMEHDAKVMNMIIEFFNN